MPSTDHRVVFIVEHPSSMGKARYLQLSLNTSICIKATDQWEGITLAQLFHQSSRHQGNNGIEICGYIPSSVP